MTWEDAIESYKTYLILEKSLSSNSVEAYLNDIKKLAKYCADKHHVTTPDAISYDHLKDYLMFINEVGVTNRTQARCISSIRSFYKFLVFDGQLENNPTKLLEAPKIGRKLPNILTTEEIDAMLNSVEMYKPEAQRNKAIIEMLYSCGLRVSELISIKLSNINFRQGIVKIEGKGNKERMIPLSKNAKQEIKQYMKVYRDYLEIEKVIGREILDSRGNPTVEAEVTLADGWTLDAEGNEYSGTGLRYKEVTAEEAGDYALNVTLADGRILMPLHIMWASSENNPVSALLATMLSNGKQTADAGMQIEQTTMTFSELLNWIYRDTSVGDQYGVFTYGMFNLATGFADVYDYAYNFASDPESDYVKMGYNQNYIFDKELDDLSMDMVYKSAPGDDATYLDYFQKFIVRWNALLPEIPLYCNDYHTFFPSWLKNYNESSLWDFQKAIVYASIEGAE